MKDVEIFELDVPGDGYEFASSFSGDDEATFLSSVPFVLDPAPLEPESLVEGHLVSTEAGGGGR